MLTELKSTGACPGTGEPLALGAFISVAFVSDAVVFFERVLA
jgi:hypothetical protein